MLADDLGIPFIELNRVVERIVGCGVHEIHSFYGSAAYRRYEQRAGGDDRLVPTGRHRHAGGQVSEPSTFGLLLSRCYTIWLRASPEEHMNRVVAQGDLRPMAGNAEQWTT
jgi:XRE family aerobic/anaerobic benzoate catabolism transcriptional regulator